MASLIFDSQMRANMLIERGQEFMDLEACGTSRKNLSAVIQIFIFDVLMIRTVMYQEIYYFLLHLALYLICKNENIYSK